MLQNTKEADEEERKRVEICIALEMIVLLSFPPKISLSPTSFITVHFSSHAHFFLLISFVPPSSPYPTLSSTALTNVATSLSSLLPTRCLSGAGLYDLP